MTRRLLAAVLALLCAGPAVAQQPAFRTTAGVADLAPVPGVGRNFVGDLAVQGDSLWAGPLLRVTPDGGRSWLQAEVDSITEGRARVYALDVEGPRLWASLGTRYQQDVNQDGRDDDVFEAIGYAYTDDHGARWTFRPPALDPPSATQIQYGRSTLPAEPIVVPQLATAFDVFYDAPSGTVWSANWYGGLRRSTDEGRTWQRVVLPPDTLQVLRPDGGPYSFRVGPPSGAPTERYDNYFAFSVLVDEAGVVWAGTAGGLNRSDDGGTTWRLFRHDGTPGSLLGNWVIALREQPRPGRNALWIASRVGRPDQGSAEAFGITVTRDGGATFEQVLIGERINDFAFAGSTVYAAGDRGLFVSDDDGATWRSIRSFRDPAQPGFVVRPDVRVLAVAVTRGGDLWAGTSDGLLRSRDGGATWTLFRANIPLRGDGTDAQVPTVDAYAYPNPFSPASDRLLRFVFEQAAAGPAEIQVLDFAMRRVRRLTATATAAGRQEVAWDGTDAGGLRLPNGVYHYVVDAGGQKAWGKIMILE